MIPERVNIFFHVFQINDQISLMASSSSQPLIPPDLIHGVPSKASPLQSSKFNFIPSLSSSASANSFIPSRESNLSTQTNIRTTSGRKKVRDKNLSIFNFNFLGNFKIRPSPLSTPSSQIQKMESSKSFQPNLNNFPTKPGLSRPLLSKRKTACDGYLTSNNE